MFYLIKSGFVTVFQDIKEDALRTPHLNQESEELEIMELGEGEHFGEQALLTHAVRAATVRARTDVVLLALDRQAFQDLLGPVEVWDTTLRLASVCACVVHGVTHATPVWRLLPTSAPAQNLLEVTHSQRRLAAARVHLEREESVRSMRLQLEAEQKEGSASDEAGSEEGATKKKKVQCALHMPPRADLRKDCVLKNLRPIAVLGEGAFGVVQLVEHVVRPVEGRGPDGNCNVLTRVPILVCVCVRVCGWDCARLPRRCLL